MQTFEAARAEWIPAGVVVFRDVPGGTHHFDAVALLLWPFYVA